MSFNFLKKQQKLIYFILLKKNNVDNQIIMWFFKTVTRFCFFSAISYDLYTI